MIDYEILLMLDPETPDERQQEIVTRTRELIERGGGHFDKHEVWGRRKLAYEIDHKPDGSYHLLTFAAEPGCARRGLAHPQDHRRRHAPPGRPPPEARAHDDGRASAPRDADREPEYAAPAIETDERE